VVPPGYAAVSRRQPYGVCYPADNGCSRQILTHRPSELQLRSGFRASNGCLSPSGSSLRRSASATWLHQSNWQQYIRRLNPCQSASFGGAEWRRQSAPGGSVETKPRCPDLDEAQSIPRRRVITLTHTLAAEYTRKISHWEDFSDHYERT
jgi:hypothetical protein